MEAVSDCRAVRRRMVGCAAQARNVTVLQAGAQGGWPARLGLFVQRLPPPLAGSPPVLVDAGLTLRYQKNVTCIIQSECNFPVASGPLSAAWRIMKQIWNPLRRPKSFFNWMDEFRCRSARRRRICYICMYLPCLRCPVGIFPIGSGRRRNSRPCAVPVSLPSPRQLKSAPWCIVVTVRLSAQLKRM